MPYMPPKATPIDTLDLCNYGCGQPAKYKFAGGKLCCDISPNKCPKKRKTFSERTDHKETAAKSLATRVRLGITKSSQIQAAETRKSTGHYQKLAKIMKDRWSEKPWSNNLQCPLLLYKNTNLLFQGSYELDFLQELEEINGLDWIVANVKRGPNIWYTDPHDQTLRLYISDFIIDTTIYEIKSKWTWNKHGKDLALEETNRAKLDACISQGFRVVLVLNGEKIKYGLQ